MGCRGRRGVGSGVCECNGVGDACGGGCVGRRRDGVARGTGCAAEGTEGAQDCCAEVGGSRVRVYIKGRDGDIGGGRKVRDAVDVRTSEGMVVRVVSVRADIMAGRGRGRQNECGGGKTLDGS